ncbi:Cupin [Musa troglodytarum]|uniref:Cupin n=1 Tax=Musa troglodytarum TaxID=320322 RepID=A0A9E7L315_9LILI|nr:Cupin [Musa troglodytarum]
MLEYGFNIGCCILVSWQYLTLCAEKFFLLMIMQHTSMTSILSQYKSWGLKHLYERNYNSKGLQPKYDVYSERVKGAFVVSDPVDWGRDIQAVFPAERLGMGAFRIALESIYNCIHSSPLEYTSFGKPNPFVFKNAESILTKLVTHKCQVKETMMGEKCAFSTIYMIGDNPKVDINGAKKINNQHALQAAAASTIVFTTHAINYWTIVYLIRWDIHGFLFSQGLGYSGVKTTMNSGGTYGIVLPEATKEKVIAIKKGDAIALPFGVVTWWFNPSDAELVVLFLGDTSKGHKADQFTNFPITGGNGIFTGFTTDFVGRAWDLTEDEAKKLVHNQTNVGIVKVKDGQAMLEPSTKDREGMVLNCLEAPLDVDIKNGGCVVVLNTKNLPLVGEVGLGADLVRLNGHDSIEFRMIEDLRHKLTCTNMELEELRTNAHDEQQEAKETIRQLVELLELRTSERDEARNQLQLLLNQIEQPSGYM